MSGAATREWEREANLSIGDLGIGNVGDEPQELWVPVPVVGRYHDERVQTWNAVLARACEKDVGHRLALRGAKSPAARCVDVHRRHGADLGKVPYFEHPRDVELVHNSRHDVELCHGIF